MSTRFENENTMRMKYRPQGERKTYIQNPRGENPLQLNKQGGTTLWIEFPKERN